jgi:hypothetical protein
MIIMKNSFIFSPYWQIFLDPIMKNTIVIHLTGNRSRKQLLTDGSINSQCLIFCNVYKIHKTNHVNREVQQNNGWNGQIEDAVLTQTNVMYHVEPRSNSCSRGVQGLLVWEAGEACRLSSSRIQQSGGQTPPPRPQGGRQWVSPARARATRRGITARGAHALAPRYIELALGRPWWDRRGLGGGTGVRRRHSGGGEAAQELAVSKRGGWGWALASTHEDWRQRDGRRRPARRRNTRWTSCAMLRRFLSTQYIST